MNNHYHSTITNLPGQVETREIGPRFASGPLEVNVVFTDPEATSVALGFAQSLALDLGAHIRLRAAVAVPFQLPLDEPPVSLPFFREVLRKLARGLERSTFQPTIPMYLCRDRVRALLQVLRPNSVVVIGGRKRWWPTAESRMARALRSEGHRVILVDSKARSALEPLVVAR